MRKRFLSRGEGRMHRIILRLENVLTPQEFVIPNSRSFH